MPGKRTAREMIIDSSELRDAFFEWHENTNLHPNFECKHSSPFSFVLTISMRFWTDCPKTRYIQRKKPSCQAHTGAFWTSSRKAISISEMASFPQKRHCSLLILPPFLALHALYSSTPLNRLPSNSFGRR